MRKAVLVSLDAFFDADFRFLREDGGLTRMLREGSFCRQVKTVFPALTYPAHVTLITGCDPADSRVGQNQPFQPGVPSGSRVWNWERKHIAVPTLFDAVRAAGGRNCSVLWPVCCKNPAADWCFPEVHPLPGENVVLKTLRFGSPLFVLDSERRFGSLRQGIAEPGLKGHSDLAAGHREDWGERACANMARLGSEVMGFLGDDGNQIADCQRDLFDAPAIVYLTMHKGTPDFGKLDMGGFAQSLMLSAREHGVDSVIAYEFVRYPEEARKFMGIPDDEAVVIGIGLGYADERKINSFRSSRAPLDEVLIVKS